MTCVSALCFPLPLPQTVPKTALLSLGKDLRSDPLEQECYKHNTGSQSWLHKIHGAVGARARVVHVV